MKAVSSKRFVAGLALSLLLLILLLAAAPARLVSYFLPTGQVVVNGLSGTLWRGSAASCMIKVQGGYLHLGQVDWDLHTLSLLRLAPEISLASRWGSQTFEGDLRVSAGGQLRLTDLEASLPASLAQQFAPLALEGSLSAQFETLVIENELPLEAKGRLVWQNGAWLSPQGRVPLGSYAVDIEQPEGERLLGDVITLSGPVSAEGQVQLVGRSYLVDALVSGDNGLDQQVQQALSLVATPEARGFRVRLGGEL